MLINQRVFVTKRLQIIESNTVGALVKWLILKVQRSGRKLSQKFPYLVRVLVAEIVPDCPLTASQKEVNTLSVMVPCIDKYKLIVRYCDRLDAVGIVGI